MEGGPIHSHLDNKDLIHRGKCVSQTINHLIIETSNRNLQDKKLLGVMFKR
jgi:hypothetical protein